MRHEQIQGWIHALEVGSFSRWLKYLPVVVAMIGLAVLYDVRAYHGFTSPEAMDAAQVARNLAEGHGYTTDFIRPFSVYLVQKHNRATHPAEARTTNALDFAQLDGTHPDLANAPVYPTLLAGLMKLGSLDWQVEMDKPFWSANGKFLRYRPEFKIAVLNQVLLLLAVALTFLIAKKLFDAPAAWLAAALTLGADLLWKFSVSGLSTLLLLVIFLGLVWCLAKLEELARAEQPSVRRLFTLAAVAGLILGLGMMTRYAFGWVIVPVTLFLAFFGGTRRAGLAVTTWAVFALTALPWIIRNLAVSGTCFGTAGYAIAEDTYLNSGSQLMQSIDPDFSLTSGITPYTHKFFPNLSDILQNGLLPLAGWLGVLFFAGLLLGLRNVTARRLRYFTLMCLATLMIVQALGQTSMSDLSPGLNSENLMVLFVPLMIIFGTVFFLTLLDQMNLPEIGLRYAVIGLLAVLACEPLAATILARTNPVSYPPYYPPEIQQVSGWMKPDELMMSDAPWAVAWYGHHECLWLPLDAKSDFYAVNDYLEPIKGIYFTRLTMDGKFLSDMARGDEGDWGHFIYNIGLKKTMPAGFPLKSPKNLATGLFLTDRPRWETQ
jgi:hypothetical protein